MHPNVPLINFTEPRITMRPEIQTIFIWFCKTALTQIALEIAGAALPVMTACHRCSSCTQYVICTVLAKILKYV